MSEDKKPVKAPVKKENKPLVGNSSAEHERWIKEQTAKLKQEQDKRGLLDRILNR